MRIECITTCNTIIILQKGRVKVKKKWEPLITISIFLIFNIFLFKFLSTSPEDKALHICINNLLLGLIIIIWKL